MPYSKFAVGAALECDDGSTITGCNVENVSYGLTICAERTAVCKAVSCGKRKFSSIAVSAVNDSFLVSPCGACRQVLAEFNPSLKIYLYSPKTGIVGITDLQHLLPHAVTPSNMNGILLSH
jgi:cytidine deaminase